MSKLILTSQYLNSQAKLFLPSIFPLYSYSKTFYGESAFEACYLIGNSRPRASRKDYNSTDLTSDFEKFNVCPGNGADWQLEPILLAKDKCCL